MFRNCLRDTLDSSKYEIANLLDRDGVCKTCDEVDGNIKSMYQLMAKVNHIIFILNT